MPASLGGSGVALPTHIRTEPHLGEAYSYASSHSLLEPFLAPFHAQRQPTIADLRLYITQPDYRPFTLLTPLPAALPIMSTNQSAQDNWMAGLDDIEEWMRSMDREVLDQVSDALASDKQGGRFFFYTS